MFTDICNAVNSRHILWKKHALERMMERGISRTQVKLAILQGIIIEYYSDDYPIPSVLLATPEPEPLHAVVVLLMTPYLNYAISLLLTAPI